jgi:transcriptional regulator with XRE-family HTH domain
MAEDDYDALVGRNVRRLRDAQGLTQADVAERLVEQGLPFRQQTIVKIEKGQRPLRQREARAIASALDVLVDDLDAEEMVVDRAANLRRHTHDLYTSLEALKAAVGRFEEAKAHLRQTLAWSADRQVPQHLLNDAATVLQFEAPGVVESALAMLKAQAAVDAVEFGGGVDVVRYDAHATGEGPTDGEHPEA